MAEQNHGSFASQDEAAAVAKIIDARRKRISLFSPNLFADPAWDMMLELFHAHLEGRRLATSELAHKANVPVTTSLRWIDKLETDGWVSREPDPHDLRRVFADISQRGLETMRAWLKEWLEQSSTNADDPVTDLLNRIRGDKP